VDVTVRGRVCEECTTRLEPWEGQPAPRLYGFTAKQVATALVLVAGGASYRATAALTQIRELCGLVGVSWNEQMPLTWENESC